MSQQNLLFPARVLRGAGVINQLGVTCAGLSQRALLIGGQRAIQAVAIHVSTQLDAAGVTLLAPVWFDGETSSNHIERLATLAIEQQVEVLIGAGGGKSVGAQLGLPVITVPTIAATYAAVTPLTIHYDDNGKLLRYFPAAARRRLR